MNHDLDLTKKKKIIKVQFELLWLKFYVRAIFRQNTDPSSPIIESGKILAKLVDVLEGTKFTNGQKNSIELVR
jgi:hypothetical protein